MTTNDIDTVTVLQSRTVARPDGRAAIVLTVQRRPTEPAFQTAFEVTLETLAILRNEIARAEMILTTQTGRA